MSRDTAGVYGKTDLVSADPELLFEIDDERWRECFRQLMDNSQALLKEIRQLQTRVQRLEDDQ